MILRIDLATAPPALTLVDPEDLGSFSAQVVLDSHAWIAPETLERLGPKDPEWAERLGGMLAYARKHGWTDERGHVRAHVEVVDERGAADNPA